MKSDRERIPLHLPTATPPSLTLKRVKQWGFAAESSKLGRCVRYGSRTRELAKGKFSVEVASAKELVPTLELLKNGVLNGELASAIDAASVKHRAAFGWWLRQQLPLLAYCMVFTVATACRLRSARTAKFRKRNLLKLLLKS